MKGWPTKMTLKFHSLAWKLTLSFLAIAIMATVLVALFIRLSSANELDRLIVAQQRSDFQSNLVNYYETHGSWDGVQVLVRDSGNGTHHNDRRARNGLFGLLDGQGTVLIPFSPNSRDQSFPQEVLATGVPVVVDGVVVGTILTDTRDPDYTPAEAEYLRRANTAVALASSGAIFLALLAGVLLARTLTRPLDDLTQAVHRMAGGELAQEVQVKSADEIGELAHAFNQMSQEVARANNARRQMTADVAHELRTPLTVIAGYIESMRDGILAPTTERLDVIYGEIDHLQHLVGDLRTLTQADAGELKLNRQPLTVSELLQQSLAAFAQSATQNGVLLELVVDDNLPAVNLDETRMAQVLGNLITNALRYTPSGGRIVLAGVTAKNGVRLSVQDTGQGIPAEELPLVFNRFHRADKSRHDESGGSGLGLAIAKAIVEAHGGQISVESKVGVGTTFRLYFPA